MIRVHGKAAVGSLGLAATVSAMALVSACTSGSSTTDAGAGLASTATPMKATGVLKATVGGQAGSVDYTGLLVKTALTHKINTDPKGLACVPLVNLAVEKEDGTCRIELDFKPGFDGTQLELSAAKFTAKLGIKQGNTTIQTKPCVGWPEEPKKDEVIYQLESGAGTLSMQVLGQPQAGQSNTTLKSLDFQPQGTVTLKVPGQARKFDLDLSQLRFQGDAASVGSNDAALQCAKTTYDMPKWELPDINKASPTTGQTLNLNQFLGKRVVVLNGAGWCASCVAQTKSMEKLRAQLAGQGRDDVVFVAINNSDAIKDQGTITSGVQVAVVQATSSAGWASMKRPDGKAGQKNDGFFFDYNGKLMGFFEGAGTVYTNVWEDWMAKNVGQPKGELGIDCKNGGGPDYNGACKMREE